MKTAYTQEQWTIDGTFKAQVGQVVADDVVAELRDGVPPVTMGDGILQVGEAVNHSYTGEALYTTFERTPDGWRYAGSCFEGEVAHRTGWGKVEGDVIALKFRGVDDFNRPVFIEPTTRRHFGDTHNLLPWHADEHDALLLYARTNPRKSLTYFGRNFNCEPMGTPIPDHYTIIIEWQAGETIIPALR